MRDGSHAASRPGYWLNQFCLSLTRADQRARFEADESAYLDAWPLTEAQKAAVMARDLQECERLGGSRYFLSRLTPR